MYDIFLSEIVPLLFSDPSPSSGIIPDKSIFTLFFTVFGAYIGSEY